MAAVALMVAVVKWASHGFSSEFLMVVRWSAGLAVFVAFHAICKGASLRTARWRAQAIAAICWTVSIFLYYLSIRHIPLMDATLLLNTSALFAPVLTLVFTGQREPPSIWIGSAIGFVGVLVVLRPGSEVFQPMALLALASGLAMAFRIFVLSLLADEPKQRTTFYSLAVGLGVCLLLLAATGFQVARPSWEQMLFSSAQFARPLFVDSALIVAVVALGALSMLQTLLLAGSLQYATVGQIVPFRYTAVVFSAMLDWLFWNQQLSWSGLLGLGLIAIGALLVLRNRHKAPTTTLPI